LKMVISWAENSVEPDLLESPSFSVCLKGWYDITGERKKLENFQLNLCTMQLLQI
jgi:hypothetical protein